MTDVAVLGGGIGGLTAAHELAERGCSVTVFEANGRFGGKARSMPIVDGSSGGDGDDNGDGDGNDDRDEVGRGDGDDRRPLHGEHGFRFFPAFYRHVIDTMARIPDGNATVADNLVETEATLIASASEPNRIAETRTPDTVRGWLEALRPAFAADLPADDVRFLLERLLYLLTSCEERRENELDDISWWAFIDAENRSSAFRTRLAYATQALVALRPQVGSARTIGTIYLQLLFGQLDPSRPTERILNGPTSEAWIEPWLRHLETLGVDLRPNAPVRGLEFDGRRVTGAALATGETVAADEYVLAVPVEVAPEFVTPDLARAAPELGRIGRLETAWMNGVQFYLREEVELTRGHQVYTESPWALTSIFQGQFWGDHALDARGPDEVGDVLSVIASDWDAPGICHEKPARECTREEVAEEVWVQLKRHLDEPGKRLRDDTLVGWFLDPSLVETPSGLENRSPLLINTVGSLRNRPPADVSIPNLTLASDYVRTNADLASMESANEAGRRAANAICDRNGIDAPRVNVWDLEEPAVFDPLKRQDRIRYRLGLPHPAEVTQSLRTVTNRLKREI